MRKEDPIAFNPTLVKTYEDTTNFSILVTKTFWKTITENYAGIPLNKYVELRTTSTRYNFKRDPFSGDLLLLDREKPIWRNVPRVLEVASLFEVEGATSLLINYAFLSNEEPCRDLATFHRGNYTPELRKYQRQAIHNHILNELFF